MLKMGYAYNELVPAAILFENPGISREKFVDILNSTNTSWCHQYKPEEEWTHHDETNDDFHNGLGGLANILGLEESKKYAEFQKPIVDENRLCVRPPYIFHLNREKDDEIDVFYEDIRYIYKVVSKIVVTPEGLSDYVKKNTDENSLTLQTCYPPGTSLNRLIVIAKKLFA